MLKAFSGSLVLMGILISSSWADDQAGAKAILDQAIEAHGGKAVLGRFVGERTKAKGTLYEGDKKVPMTYVWYYQGTDKMRTLSYDEGAATASEIEVVNGAKGWVKDIDQPTDELDPDQLKSRLETIYVSWATVLVPLRADDFRLSLLKEITVNGHKAVGILVAHDKHRPLKLYFDSDTHLLVEYEREFRNAEVKKDFTEVTIYSDYDLVQGTKQPRKMTTLWDGVKVADMKCEEIEFYEKPLDEKLFAKP